MQQLRSYDCVSVCVSQATLTRMPPPSPRRAALVDCPICGKSVPSTRAQSHVDECLAEHTGELQNILEEDDDDDENGGALVPCSQIQVRSQPTVAPADRQST